GARPFLGDNLATYVSNVVQGRIVSPEQLPPEMPTELLAILERGLSVAAQERFASMSELAEALERLQVSSTTGSTHAAVAFGDSALPERENARGTARLLVVAAVAVVLAAGAWWFTREDETSREGAQRDARAAMLLATASGEDET